MGATLMSNASHAHTRTSRRNPTTLGVHVKAPASPYDDGVYRSGDVVIINLLNAIENRQTTGKRRPAVLIRRENGHWKTMGLTTNPRYRDGGARVAIPDPRAVGLRRPGWLWGNRLSNVAALDVERCIGRVDEAMADSIIELAGLDDDAAAALQDAAKQGRQP